MNGIRFAIIGLGYRAGRVVENIWCVSAGNPSSRHVSDGNSALHLKVD